MSLLAMLWGYHQRCPVCGAYSAKRNAAGQWLCSQPACRNYYRKDLVRRLGRAVVRQAVQRVPPVADTLGRRVAADNAAELARLQATAGRKPETPPDIMNVAAWVVLSQLPPELLAAPLEQLVARHGKRSDFVFRFARQEVLAAIHTGKLEFTVGDLLKRFPHQVFSEAAGRLREQRITIPLGQIAPHAPAAWFNRAPEWRAPAAAPVKPAPVKPPPLPAAARASTPAHPAAGRQPATAHPTASRQPAASQEQPGAHPGCVIGLVVLTLVSFVFRFPIPIRIFLTVFAVLAVIGWIQSRTGAHRR